jgi:uncharacterized repeat protein (TIGR04138 family)
MSMSGYSKRICDLSAASGIPKEIISFLFDAIRYAPNYNSEEPGDAKRPNRRCAIDKLCTAFVGFAEDTFEDEYASVLREWDLDTSEKLGRAVFRLVEVGGIRMTAGEQVSDFNGHFDLTKDYG